MGVNAGSHLKAVAVVALLLAGFVFGAGRLHWLMVRRLPSSGLKAESKVPISQNDVHARLEAAARNMNVVRDPFCAVPIVSVSAAEGAGFEVKGIFWDAGKPMAIINETVVRIGDMINNKIVVDIQKDRVILESNGQYLEYRVQQEK